MKPKNSFEQRASLRVAVRGVAMVRSCSGAANRYRLADVSLGGARVCGTPPLVVGAPIDGTLRVPGVPPIRLRGRVVRVEEELTASAVKFTEILGDGEDLIQDVAVRSLERIPIAAVVVVHRDPKVRSALSRALRDLGHRVIVASTPLEVLTWLSKPTPPIASVAIDMNLGLVPTNHLLRFIEDSHPSIQRYVIADQKTAGLAQTEVHEGRAEAVLRAPWQSPALESVAPAPSIN